MKEAFVELNKNGKKTSFKIYHNLPERFGLSLQCALDNWLARTNKYTACSFCEYIKSKDISFIALTEKQFNKVKSNGSGGN